MTQVHIVTYEWRNWSRDIIAFATLEQAEQSVIHTAKDTVTAAEADDITDVESARNALTHHEHVVWIDSLDITP